MVSLTRINWRTSVLSTIFPSPDPTSTNPKRRIRGESPTRPLKHSKEGDTVIHGVESAAELSLRASAAAAAAAAHDVVYQSYYPGLQHDPQLHYSQHNAIENWPPEPQPEVDRAAAAGGVLIVVSSNAGPNQTVLPKEDYNYASPAIYTSPTDNVRREEECTRVLSG